MRITQKPITQQILAYAAVNSGKLREKIVRIWKIRQKENEFPAGWGIVKGKK